MYLLWLGSRHKRYWGAYERLATLRDGCHDKLRFQGRTSSKPHVFSRLLCNANNIIMNLCFHSIFIGFKFFQFVQCHAVPQFHLSTSRPRLMSEVRWQRANTWRIKQRQRNINFQVERMCLKAPGPWLQGTCKRLRAKVLDLWECSLSSSTSYLRGRILANILVSTSYTLRRNPRGAKQLSWILVICCCVLTPICHCTFKALTWLPLQSARKSQAKFAQSTCFSHECKAWTKTVPSWAQLYLDFFWWMTPVESKLEVQGQDQLVEFMRWIKAQTLDQNRSGAPRCCYAWLL